MERVVKMTWQREPMANRAIVCRRRFKDGVLRRLDNRWEGAREVFDRGK